ncbi:MAG: hypothetical protein JKY50_10265 [Oleispira sp.]|nr:hypothetical protein [Oleispira sp.]
MASISSAGSFAIPAAQPARRQADTSVKATETELTVKQEQQVQRASDEQGRGSSEQIKDGKATTEKPSSSSVTQADDKKSAEQQKEQRLAEQQRADGEQQKIEAAQQEAQIAEFDQRAGNVRETEPNDVRPPSSDSAQDAQRSQDEQEQPETVVLTRDNLSSENTAIETFNQFQNIDAAPRQGQELNQFA